MSQKVSTASNRKRCDEIVFGSGRGDDDDNKADPDEESFWTPNQICITGYDKTTTAKFAKYANALGIELSNKWSVQSTDILISKSNIQNGKPQNFRNPYMGRRNVHFLRKINVGTVSTVVSTIRKK